MVNLGAGNPFGRCHILSPDQLIVFAFSSTYSLLSLIVFPCTNAVLIIGLFLGPGWIAASPCSSPSVWLWSWPHASSNPGC
jgi:hypothetical protein